jgi:hypothetical protein
MKSFLVFMISFALGILLGQALMRYAYDPAVLEYVTLHSVGLAYFHGCRAQMSQGVQGQPIDDCAKKALEYQKEVGQIWHDKV